MDIRAYYAKEGEKPLDNIVQDGGFCKIFRTIACIGDSLSSGEFESQKVDGSSDYHDMYEYSWGQYMAREAGIKVYNFSRGGMTALEYHQFAEENGFWDEDKLCQAYILALGVNDILNQEQPVGTMEDVINDDGTGEPWNFAVQYARIIKRYQKMQPKAKFFLMTMPRTTEGTDSYKVGPAMLLREMAEYFPNTYVIDLFEYAPVYDEEFKKYFYLAGHLNPAGYALTAKMVMSYIDFYVRQDPEAFAQVGFIGTPYSHPYEVQ